MATPTPHAASARRRTSAKSAVLAALVVLNAALVLSLTGRIVAPSSAQASASAQGARVSEYVMIPSRPLGVNQDVLYILDVDNTRLLVAGYDQPGRRIEFLGPLDLRTMLNR